MDDWWSASSIVYGPSSDKGATMSAWEYKVVYVDFRGRVSIEGEELYLEKGQRRSEFVRRVLNHLGKDGWELVGVHPLWPAETSYMVFKREGVGEAIAPKPEAAEEAPKEPDSSSQDTVKISQA